MKIRNIIEKCAAFFVVSVLTAAVIGCGKAETESISGEKEYMQTEIKDKNLIMLINGNEIPVIWEDNPSVEALKKMAADRPEIQMNRYGGFEQVGPFGRPIACDDENMKTSPGDVVLYEGNHIVIFYKGSEWSYTRLGKIDLPENEIVELLENEDVTLVLELS